MQADGSIRITASIGAAMLDGLTDTEVWAHADLAMYEAKAGRNRVEMYRRVKGHQPALYGMKTPQSIDMAHVAQLHRQ